MPTEQRKTEVHRLTILGPPEGTAYGRFPRNPRGKAGISRRPCVSRDGGEYDSSPIQTIKGFNET